LRPNAELTGCRSAARAEGTQKRGEAPLLGSPVERRVRLFRAGKRIALPGERAVKTDVSLRQPSLLAGCTLLTGKGTPSESARQHDHGLGTLTPKLDYGNLPIDCDGITQGLDALDFMHRLSSKV